MNTLRLHIRSIGAWKEILHLKPVNYEGYRSIKRWVAKTQMEITRRKKELDPQPQPPVRSNFLEWNREAEIYAFNERLCEKFDLNLLNQAFTHKSYILHEEHRQRLLGVEDFKLAIYDNESLITSGAEVTSKTVYNYLVQSLPNLPETGVNVIKDYLLSEPVLSTAARNIGVKDIVLTEEHPVADKTLASTFLALVGALKASTDVNRAALFVRDFLIAILANKDLSEIWTPSDPMDSLNKILSKENRGLAEPRLIAEAGRNTILSSYQVGLYSDKQYLGAGFGQTIEEAQYIAALNVLCRIYGLLDCSNPIRYNKQIDISHEVNND